MISLKRDRRRGQTLIEYALLATLLAMVAVTILSVLGRRTRDAYVNASDQIQTAAPN